MYDFLINFGIMIAGFGAWFAFGSIRRIHGIARGRITVADMSLRDIENSQGLDTHPAFGAAMKILIFRNKLVHPFSQFLRRWLIYFPLAWLTNMLYTATWLFALPLGSFVSSSSELMCGGSFAAVGTLPSGAQTGADRGRGDGRPAVVFW